MYKKLIKMNSSIVFKYFIFLSLILCLTRAKAQTSRIAILDFQNISGISKYDGLGKAMSSMLISDIESNISIKRLQFVERGQIQKISNLPTIKLTARHLSLR